MQTTETQEQWQAVKFHGDGGEYFRIWIVNLVLTILTLGIYSAWATVRNRRYFYGNTEVAGGRFDFHGSPVDILFGRFIALVLLLGWSQGALVHPYVSFASMAIVVGLLPWFLVRAWRFRLANTSLRNLRFGYGGSAKNGYKTLAPYLLMLAVASTISLHYSNKMQEAVENVDEQRRIEQTQNPEQTPEQLAEQLAASPEYQQARLQANEALQTTATVSLVVLAIVFLIYPIFVCDVRRLNINHSQYGNSRFAGEYSREPFLRYFWTAIGVFIAGIIALAILGGLLMLVASAIGASIGIEGGWFVPALAAVAAYLLIIYVQFVSYAYWFTRVFNYTANQLSNGPMKFRAQMVPMHYALLLLKTTLLVLFTLGFGQPWAKVMLARYQLEHMEYSGNAEDFIAQNQQQSHAIGDEVGEAFDIDFGF